MDKKFQPDGPNHAGNPKNIPDHTPYASFAIRLTLLEWLCAIAIVAAVITLVPILWQQVEEFESSGTDYRIPYKFSQDYWLYQRRVEKIEPAVIPIIGDSVIWGEYVSADGTLSHFLNEVSQKQPMFCNAGVNGLYPLAIEGLIRHYGSHISNRSVILHFNLLWMSSPAVDLSSEKEQVFNHPDLVPQFFPKLPCYRASFDERISAVLKCRIPILKWVSHLQNVYFEQKNFYTWTLASDNDYPPSYPNALTNPFSRITMSVPGPPSEDPDRGLGSPRHKPWSNTGVGSQKFDWVSLQDSQQFSAFQRLVNLLLKRDNKLLIIIGPFNEHVMTDDNAIRFRQLQNAVAANLQQYKDATTIVLEPLPSELYADSSHPTTEGYSMMAQQLLKTPAFIDWQESTVRCDARVQF